MKKVQSSLKKVLKEEQLKATKTLTTIFLLPTIDISKVEKEKYGFVNAYIKDENYDDTLIKGSSDYNLYVLFKPDSLEDLVTYIEETNLRDPNTILDYYDLGFGYMMVVYRYPLKFEREYNLFMSGRYSKFSDDFKSIFPMTKDAYRDGVKVGKEYTIYHNLFNRTEWLIDVWKKRLGVVELDEDAELWSKPIVEEETFNINKIAD